MSVSGTIRLERNSLAGCENVSANQPKATARLGAKKRRPDKKTRYLCDNLRSTSGHTAFSGRVCSRRHAGTPKREVHLVNMQVMANDEVAIRQGAGTVAQRQLEGRPLESWSWAPFDDGIRHAKLAVYNREVPSSVCVQRRPSEGGRMRKGIVSSTRPGDPL